MVPGRYAASLLSFVLESVAKGSIVRTDGWGGYEDLPKLGYQHEPLVLAGEPDAADAHLPMIHLVFSNLKTWILGTHHISGFFDWKHGLFPKTVVFVLNWASPVTRHRARSFQIVVTFRAPDSLYQLAG